MTSDKDSKDMFMSLKDWRQAIRTPPSYRVGNSMVRLQTHFFTLLGVLFVFLLFVYFNITGQNRYSYRYRNFDKENGYSSDFSYSTYNATYPLTKPVSVHDSVRYRIGLVSDLDHSSRSKDASNTWESYFLQGHLMWNPISMTATISWDAGRPRKLKSTYGHSGRGMELSELVTFDGKLLTFDDRSGIVFVVENDNFYPWILLLDGNGKNNKGFKAEWATVKDEKLYIGGLGKEWTTATGEFQNYNPMWIKVVNRYGEVSHLNWVDQFKAIRSRLGIEFPGYMIHEAVLWSNVHKRWFFLPRRASHNTYNEDADELMGTNVLLTAKEDFSDITATQIGEVIPTHGFSSFKFIPGTRDEVIVALKTVEYKGKIESYIMVFTIHGKINLGETRIPEEVKFEGFEFI